MNVLAVAAHPDDIELLCAGTLARYVADGHTVTLVVFTDGSMGDVHLKPRRLASIRRKEAAAAAKILGARLLWPAICDEHVFPDAAQRRVMIDLLRTADPDVILTHSPNDYHPDHRYVGQLVFDSYFQKGLPHIPRQQRRAGRFAQATIYFMDNVAGLGFLPTEYVDITATMEVKRRMIKCHKSQFAAMAELANADLGEMAEIHSRFRGMGAGCRFAEAFTRCDTYYQGRTSRVLP
jgi:LmbE family N-acetylglucosaminyl deacetylase